jgi:hypothetical protein
MPVVGMTPSIYGFNNLNSVLNPYMNQFSPNMPFGANEIQFYSPSTGQLGPSFKPGNILNDMRRGFENNPFYNVVSTQFPNLSTEPVVKTLRYDNGKINLGVIGTVDDLNILKKILDDHYARHGLAASTDSIASPSAPPPPIVAAPVVAAPVVAAPVVAPVVASGTGPIVFAEGITEGDKAMVKALRPDRRPISRPVTAPFSPPLDG